MNKKDISKLYIELIKMLDDDETFISCYYLMPIEVLAPFVPNCYLIQRYDYLKKTGKLKDWSKKNEKE